MNRNERIEYTNTNEDMLIKYTYQQFNNKKVQKRLNNTRNLYFFSGIFFLMWGVFSFFQEGMNGNGFSPLSQSVYIPVFLGLLKLIISTLVKTYKKWDIRRNVKKGIDSVEDVKFEPVIIEIHDNQFRWKNGKQSGACDLKRDRQFVFAVEDKDYVFISGKNQLDLVIPKKNLNESQKETIKELFFREQ